jgi:hypothetical protein
VRRGRCEGFRATVLINTGPSAESPLLVDSVAKLF